MKAKFLLPLIICLMLSSASYSQYQNAPEINIKTSPELTFAPQFYSIQPNLNLKIAHTSSKENNLLYGMGWVLKGLTFNSPIDEFNAVAPFDVRGYSPKDFTSYLSYIDRNHFLQKSINPIK